MADEKIQVQFGAILNQLQSGMQQAVTEVQQATQKMTAAVQDMHKQTKSSVDNMAGGIKGGFDQIVDSAKSFQRVFMDIGAVLAVGAFFKSAMSSSLEFTDQVHNLTLALGMSTEKATTLNIALREIGTSADEYIGMIQKMDRQLRTHSELFETMGVKTKDSSGHLLEQQTIMQNALSVMLSYAAGTDRNLVAQAFFGRNAQEAAKLIRLNAEEMEHARQIQEQLNLTVGEEGVEQMHKHEQAMADVKLILTTVGNEIVSAMLPAIIDLARALLECGDVIKIFGVVLTGFVDGMRILVLAVKDNIVMFKTLGLVMNDVFNFRFVDAIKHAQIGLMELQANALRTMAAITRSANVARLAVSDSTKGTSTSTEGGKGKLTGSQMEALSGKGSGEGRLSKWEEEYKGELLRIMQADGEFYEESKDNELNFWQEKLLLTKKGSQERLAVQKKITDLEIQIEKEAREAKIKDAKTEQEINLIILEGEKMQAESMMALKKEELATQSALGQISKQEEIKALQQFEKQAYKIELKAYEDKLELLKDEPVKYQEQLNKIQQLKAKHDLEMKKLENKSKLQTMQTWKQMLQPVSQAINTSIQGMIQGTQTLKQAMRNLCQSILSSFIGMLVTMLVEWIATQIAMAIFGKATQTAAAEAEIMTSAAAGAAAAGASVAYIPYYGWAMVPSVMATTFKLIAAMAVPATAAGGYDVPEDITTRLHAKEMVLPADLAEGVRGMVRGGGGDTGKTTTFKFKGIKPNEFYKGSDLVSALKILTRNNHLKAGAYR